MRVSSIAAVPTCAVCASLAGPGRAKSFGLALRHFEGLLEEVTGALRIYTAALGEGSPRFHAHMVPRYASMPKDARAWGVFDLERAAKAVEIAVALRSERRDRGVSFSRRQDSTTGVAG